MAITSAIAAVAGTGAKKAERAAERERKKQETAMAEAEKVQKQKDAQAQAMKAKTGGGRKGAGTRIGLERSQLAKSRGKGRAGSVIRSSPVLG